MIDIVFEVILSLFAVIGLICICSETAKMASSRMKCGKIVATVYFERCADKAEIIRELLEDRRFEHIIRVPADSLDECDRAELGKYIESGNVILTDDF